MAIRHDKQQALIAPTAKYIPYGLFTEIDETYYNQKPVVAPVGDLFSKGSSLKPHGENVNYQPSDFVKVSPSLALDSGSLRVNYGSYIYNQVEGWDQAHPRNERPNGLL